MTNAKARNIEFFENSSRMDDSAAAIRAGRAMRSAGEIIIRYALVLVLLWIGGMKFTALEAAGIEPLVSTSPFLRWLYRFLSLNSVSSLFGIVEITVAGLIALRPWSARLCAAGSAFAVVTFLTTISFLFSLPGWEPRLGGFPALSDAGGFLLKDTVLLGAAIWSLGESLNAAAGKLR